MRLYDQLLSNPKWHKYLDQASDYSDFTTRLLAGLHQSVVVVADNVAHYLYAGTDQEEWDLAVDFPNLAPPFEQCWIEYRYPHHLVSETVGVQRAPVELRDLTIGAYLIGIDVLQLDTRERQPQWDPDTRWHIQGFVFGSIRDQLTYSGAVRWQVDSQGQMNHQRDGRLSYESGISGQFAAEADNTAAYLTNVIQPIALAISFMHCQNVRLIEQMPSREMSRKAQRKTGQPLTRYRVLDIGPVKDLIVHEGQVETVGLKRALHICRGHFKHYTDKGLFGKTTGTFWWPQHVRGSAAQGEIVKRYNVNPPNPTHR